MPLPDPASTACAFCLNEPLSCTRMIAPFIYRDAITGWVRRFKFSGGFREGNVLSLLVAASVADTLSTATSTGTRPDIIVPVPLSLRRLLLRGHNQAIGLAQAMAQMTALPLHTRALRRIRHTTQQAELARSARARNVSRAFAATGSVKGLRIALVDDVCTTGSTLNAATRALHAAGAIEVEWWVAARTH